MESRGTLDRHLTSSLPDQPFIFLQGPVGGFFGYLAESCRRSGHPAIKIQFNLADTICDRTSSSLRFRGKGAELSGWYETLFARTRAKAVIMFGDCREIHVIAREAAGKLNIPIFSFEEGYIRPAFVTFERDGNNARSPLAGSAPGRQREPSAAAAPFNSSFAAMALKAIRYYGLLPLGRMAYPHYRHHRNRALVSEGWCWFRSSVRRLTQHRGEAALIRDLLQNHRKQYFVVALQVYDDLQLRFHAAGWTTQSLIDRTMRSFARNAGSTAHLCIKQHPLDRGHVSYRRDVARLARELGIEDRVHYLAGGEMPNLLSGAAGLVTINSTIAIGALFHNCPVFACGNVFYRVPGLGAEQRDGEALDRFFRDPPPVDEQTARDFRARIIANSQIRGSYYNEATWPSLYSEFIEIVNTELAGVSPR